MCNRGRFESLMHHIQVKLLTAHWIVCRVGFQGGVRLIHWLSLTNFPESVRFMLVLYEEHNTLIINFRLYQTTNNQEQTIVEINGQIVKEQMSQIYQKSIKEDSQQAVNL